MTYFSISAIVNTITCFMAALALYMNNPRRHINRVFSLFAVSLGLWQFFYVLWQLSETRSTAELFCRILWAAVIFTGPFFYWACVHLLGRYKEQKRLVDVTLLIGAIFAVLSITTNTMVLDVRPRLMFRFWPTAGPLHFWAISYISVLFLASFILLYRSMKNSSGLRKNQIKFILLGIVTAFFGAWTNVPLWYDIPLAPYGNILVTGFILSIVYAIVRYRFLDIRLAVTKVGLFFASYLILLAAPFTIGYGTGMWFYATIIAVFLGASAPLLYKFLVSQAEERLFSDEKKYRNILREAAQKMLLFHEVDKLAFFLVDTFVSSVNMTGAYIFMRNDRMKNYSLLASRTNTQHKCPQYLDEHHPLVKTLNRQPTYLNVEASVLEGNLSEIKTDDDLLKKISQDCSISLVFDLRNKDNSLGILALGTKNDGTFYSPDDIEVFIMLSFQSALAMENCRHLQKIKALYQASVTDKITGCYNRAFYEEYLKQAVDTAKATSQPLFLAMVDLDKFKDANDTYGHDVGDIILRLIGNIFRESVRENDIVIRYGGDEFMIIFTDITVAECAGIATSIMDSVSNLLVPIPEGGAHLKLDISASLGIAQLNEQYDQLDLVKAADEALYNAKRLGRNRYYFADTPVAASSK